MGSWSDIRRGSENAGNNFSEYYEKCRFIDLREFYINYTGNRMSHGGSGGLCPFCLHNGSFAVYRQKSIYKCFACGWWGDAMKLIYEKGGLKGKEAYQVILDLT